MHRGIRPLLAGVEMGGTKVLCAVGTGPRDLRTQVCIPTTTPAETLGRVGDFLAAAAGRWGPLGALGVCCFGPVDPDPASPDWGHVTTTPKAGWAGADVAGTLGRRLAVPVGFDTDVNGAALGEYRWGAARGLRTFAYLTVGTGIGGGGMAEGRLLHGMVHPEMGHLPVPRDPDRDPFPGCCPFHGDCLEGLASGTALRARWGRPGEEVRDRPEVWDLEADYLAAGVMAVTLVLSPQRVILGGGVMQTPGLLDRVRERLSRKMGGYLRHPRWTGGLEDFLVAPGLGTGSGVLGALVLARNTWKSKGRGRPVASSPVAREQAT